MKTSLHFAYLIISTLTAYAQPAKTYHWKVTEHIVDEAGKPLAGALAIIGYYTNSVSVTTDGITGTNGLFEFQHTSLSEGADVSFEAKKEGYYPIWQHVDLQPPYDLKKWNIDKTIVLKKIVKPVPMYAKTHGMGLKVPKYGEPFFYDLEIADWVGPSGKGIKKDIVFQKEYYDKGVEGYYSKVTVSFPKDGDGIQVYKIPDSEKGSGLRSPHEAPLDGYQPKMSREVSALRGLPSRNEHDPNRIYLFRVRTVKDHEGKIVSAHYGKIYGDFMQFSYYLNPTPNDRNVEFDPKQNLIHNLKFDEGVTAP